MKMHRHVSCMGHVFPKSGGGLAIPPCSSCSSVLNPIPVHTDRLAEIAAKYDGARIVWCQEESLNMGAWSWICPQLTDIFRKIPLYAGRGASASPAVGSLALHRLELAGLLEDAFTL